MRLKHYKVNDLIKTKKWSVPFTVRCIYKGYCIAVSKPNSISNYLIINLYDKRVFMGSARYEKYGMKSEQDFKDFIDRVIRNEIQLSLENSCPVHLILDEEEFLR